MNVSKHALIVTVGLSVSLVAVLAVAPDTIGLGTVLGQQPQDNHSAEFYEEEFFSDVDEFVKECIDVFFEDKEMHCGGKIPKRVLHSEANIELVKNMNIGDGARTAHKSLEQFDGIEHTNNNDGLISEDIKLMLDILCNYKIPKAFKAGIMIMYLELCKGVEIYHLTKEELDAEKCSHKNAFDNGSGVMQCPDCDCFLSPT